MKVIVNGQSSVVKNIDTGINQGSFIGPFSYSSLLENVLKLFLKIYGYTFESRNHFNVVSNLSPCLTPSIFEKKERGVFFFFFYPTPPFGQDMTQGQFLSGV